jgi:hypothetical protein
MRQPPAPTEQLLVVAQAGRYSNRLNRLEEHFDARALQPEAFFPPGQGPSRSEAF